MHFLLIMYYNIQKGFDMKTAISKAERKERKLVTMFERVGLNTTTLAFSKPQRIRLNVDYVKMFARQ